VNYYGLFGVRSDLHLLNEDCALHFAGGEVVVIVEADFADGYYFGVLGQIGKTVFIELLAGVVGVDSYCGVEELVFFGEADSRFQIGGAVAGAYRYHVADASIEGALDYLLAVGVELVAVQVAVGID
jgi:hypothetical protein